MSTVEPVFGFYPEKYDVPRKIGTFKLLFVIPEYRGYTINK